MRFGLAARRLLAEDLLVEDLGMRGDGHDVARGRVTEMGRAEKVDLVPMSGGLTNVLGMGRIGCRGRGIER